MTTGIRFPFALAPIKAEGQMIEPDSKESKEQTKLNAYNDLIEELQDEEVVEYLVFGDYGWGNFGEKDCPNPIPKNKRGVLLTLEEAKPFMDGWTFHGGYGSPECYATFIWTNHRVIWVTQYDGSTTLDSMPRHPVDCLPDMPGG